MRIQRRLRLGPAGAGNGTQAERLIGRFDTAQSSGSAALRAAVAGGTELGGAGEAIVWCAERAGVPRGVRPRLEGYDPAVLPTCPAVLRVSAAGAVVYGFPGSRSLAEDDGASLDFGVEFGGCLAVHGEHGMLLTDHGPETLTPVHGLGESAGEIEK